MSEITLNQLKAALEKVPGTYPDFVEGELHMAKKGEGNLIMLWEYILNDPTADSSDVILFSTRNILKVKPIDYSFEVRERTDEYLIISDKKDRIIKFGLFWLEKYNRGDNKGYYPLWLVHIYLDKLLMKYDTAMYSMTHSELIGLAKRIENSRTLGSAEERVFFKSQYFEFILSSLHGYLVINDTNCDSINLWLSRQELDSIASYIRERIAKAEDKNKRS